MFGRGDDISEKHVLIKRAKELQEDVPEYTVLCLGYCLEVLGASFEKHFTIAEELKGENLVKFLEQRSWKDNAWGAGADIDSLDTAFYHNKKYFGIEPDLDTLFTWLDSKVDPTTGMWGESGDLHDMVNGYYRLTRGTYAQFNYTVPCPERVIDTVLEHSQKIFSDASLETACNVLDIIHPLWLAGKQTDYRKIEVKELAVEWINRIIENWVSNKGFAFVLGEHSKASLMGTEMWLSILYLMCDCIGITHLLGYSPKGVHRPVTEI